MNALGHKCMLCQPKRDIVDEPTPFPTSVGRGNIMGNNGKIPRQHSNSPITPYQAPPPTISSVSEATSQDDAAIIAAAIVVPLILVLIAALVIPRYFCKSEAEHERPVFDNEKTEDEPVPAEAHTIS